MNPDYNDMLSALSEEAAEFLVVGAYALAVHGVPRATGDIDIWIRPSLENAERVLRALQRFGAPMGNLTKDDLARPGVVLQVGVAPRRIDLLTSIDAVTFDEGWRSRTSFQLGTLQVPVLGREALLKNKRATGRTTDLADVERLERLD